MPLSKKNKCAYIQGFKGEETYPGSRAEFSPLFLFLRNLQSGSVFFSIGKPLVIPAVTASDQIPENKSADEIGHDRSLNSGLIESATANLQGQRKTIRLQLFSGFRAKLGQMFDRKKKTTTRTKTI